MKRVLLTTAAIGLVVALALPVVGQGFRQGPGFGPQQAHFWGGAGPRGPRGLARVCDHGEAAMAAGLAFLEVRLGITDDQQPAWDRFEQAMDEAVQPVRALCADLPDPGNPPKTVPERMERMDRMAETAYATFQEAQTAVLTFYQELTPEQQDIADGLMPGPRGQAGRGGWGRGGRW